MRYDKTTMELGYKLRHMLKCREALFQSSCIDIPTLRYVETSIARLKIDVLSII